MGNNVAVPSTTRLSNTSAMINKYVLDSIFFDRINS